MMLIVCSDMVIPPVKHRIVTQHGIIMQYIPCNRALHPDNAVDH